MSLRLREVKHRIATTQQIRKVTSALQRVSSARLARDRDLIANAGRYTAELHRVLSAAADGVEGPVSPLMETRHRGRVLLAVFGSDRGLCGGFNTQLMNEADRFLADRRRDDVTILTLGRIINRRIRRRGLNVERFFSQPRRGGEMELVDKIVHLCTAGFLADRFREVHILYSRFVSSLVQEPTVTRLLPVTATDYRAPEEQSGGAAIAPAFEPSPHDMLRRLLPDFVRQTVQDALLNSAGSESAARQTAMSRAAQNAGDILSEQLKTYRRLRQESITTEMLELSAQLVGNRG